MANFIRRFLFDPGIETLLEIESVNILDLEPPASITGVGAGTALLVGEFEDGPFATDPLPDGPQEVTSATDFLTRFGGFGYVYDGVPGNNPSARARKPDGSLSDQYWNGNGFIALVNKKFRRLILARVDTSVGEVAFTRLPCIAGNANPSWDLEPSQTVVLDLDGTLATATFSAAAAQLNSAAGTYPSTFTGGESMNVTIDEGTPQQIGPIDITFQAADQSQTQVIARINSVLGYAAASDQGGGVTRLTGRVRGTNGSVKVNSVSAALVTTATGFSAPTSAVGTGNVANIDAVTLTDAKNVIEAAVANTRVDRDSNGNIAICAESGAAIMLDPTSTATAFGFIANLVSTEPDGFAMHTSTAGTYPTTFAGGETLTLGFDDDPNVTVTFVAGDQAIADVVNRINTTLGFTAAVAVTATRIKLTSRENGGQIRIVNATGAVNPLTQLGFTIETIDAIAHSTSTIPAGTRVRNSSGVEWVTMQTVTVREDDSGPYEVKVRPATDDGTSLGSVPASVNVLPFPIPGGYGYSVTNPNTLNAALTEAALDAAYLEAIQATRNLNSVAREANIVWAARSSNAVRVALRDNARLASAEGALGRMAVISPPLRTTRALARSNAMPGVGATRDQRVVYAYPGVQTFVSQIAQRGLAGGDGFTADGVINTTFDSWVVTVMSQLNPEENPGQEQPFTGAILGLESDNSDVSNLSIADYAAFKAAGICAPRMDNGVAYIQSGVTSVNPATHPNLKNIARRRIADFIQDTLAARLKSFGKKLNSRSRRALITQEVRAFMTGLVNDERIEGFLLDPLSGNTPETLAAGIFRLILKVRTLSSLDSIVLETEVGENVSIAEAA